ncbi:MAG: hypothetical protein HY737_04245 [Candidatus Omnitrophica bacterium]|nr:hypothetical protein [Candidatus Omnitrophota bacterium]
MRRRRWNRRGEFTFVEVMVVATVFSLMSGSLLVMTQTGNRIWQHTDDSLANTTGAQIAMDRIVEDLRRASATAGLACAADSLQMRVGADQITYARAGALLTKQVNNDPATTVAGGLTAFTPTCQADNVVKVQLVVRGNGMRSELAQTLESQVWVQNP